MRSLSDPLPLSAYRASLQRYLGGLVLPFDSVAGQIIAERLPLRYARDPLRPSLLLWACAVNGGEAGDALPVAAAFALFDRFMLLHDELTHDSAASVERWGLGQSLNAGDALYALAFRSLATGVGNPQRRLAAARLVGEAVLEAIEGRKAEDEGRCALSGAALQAGAVLAGAPPPTSEAFGRAGRRLGMAAETPDADRAERLAAGSVELLQPYVKLEDLEAYAEVARYVARRAA